MHDHHGLQCGYCTPGILMTMTAFLDENPSPDLKTTCVKRCRAICAVCNGYQNIVDAVMTAAMRTRGR